MTKGEIMTFANKFAASAGAVGLSLFAALPAWAQDAVAAAPAPVVDKGDTAWMMTATILVLMMILPPAGFLVLGLMLAAKQAYERRLAESASHTPVAAGATAAASH